MLKTTLIVVSWFQNAPLVQTQHFASPESCQLVASVTAQMIEEQARSNLSSPHRDIKVDHDKKNGEWRLSTGIIGREVARLRCVGSD